MFVNSFLPQRLLLPYAIISIALSLASMIANNKNFLRATLIINTIFLFVNSNLIFRKVRCIFLTNG